MTAAPIPTDPLRKNAIEPKTAANGARTAIKIAHEASRAIRDPRSLTWLSWAFTVGLSWVCWWRPPLLRLCHLEQVPHADRHAESKSDQRPVIRPPVPVEIVTGNRRQRHFQGDGRDLGNPLHCRSKGRWLSRRVVHAHLPFRASGRNALVRWTRRAGTSPAKEAKRLTQTDAKRSFTEMKGLRKEVI